MSQMPSKALAFCFAVSGWFTTASVVDARNIATWSITTNSAPSYASGIVTTAGHTHITLPNLAGINGMPGVNELWLFNHDNANYNGLGAPEVAALQTFVSNGGNLVFFDRRVVEASTVLPGASGIQFVRDASPDLNLSNTNLLNLDPQAPASLSLNLTNASFDGGNRSSHGFAVRSSLPANARVFLVRDENSDHATGIIYPHGAGIVFYFPVPADFYLAGSGLATMQSSLRTLLTNFANGGLIGSVQTLQYSALRTKGEVLPGAGIDTRIQAGAVWNSFGVPAINSNGNVAYLGRWKAPAAKTPVKLAAQSGVGIFVDNDLVVKVGDPVPGAGSNGLPADATFKSFKDPVLDDRGLVAFLGAIKGTDITATNDTVVVSTGREGNLEILAQEGALAPGASGARFKSFGNIALKAPPLLARTRAVDAPSTSTTIFTASLTLGSGEPAVSPVDDTGAWVLGAGSEAVELLVREGATIEGAKIKSFILLKSLAGSPAHERGLPNGQAAILQATLVDASGARQALIAAEPGTTLTTFAQTGETLGGAVVPGAVWSKLNLPSYNWFGSLAVLGSLSTKAGGVTAAQARGIFVSETGSSWEPLVRTGEVAEGFGGTATFNAFKDPVHASNSAAVAFLGSTKGGGVTPASNDGLWFSPDGSALNLIAREGAQPPGAPAGAQWKSFSSLALPGGEAGPLFTASLRTGKGNLPGPGGVTTAEDAAFYGVDGFGTLNQLLREKQSLFSKTVKNFNVLKAVAGTQGSSRAFNAEGQVVALVTFTDGSVSQVLIKLPKPALIID